MFTQQPAFGPYSEPHESNPVHILTHCYVKINFNRLTLHFSNNLYIIMKLLGMHLTNLRIFLTLQLSRLGTVDYNDMLPALVVAHNELCLTVHMFRLRFAELPVQIRTLSRNILHFFRETFVSNIVPAKLRYVVFCLSLPRRMRISRPSSFKSLPTYHSWTFPNKSMLYGPNQCS